MAKRQQGNQGAGEASDRVKKPKRQSADVKKRAKPASKARPRTASARKKPASSKNSIPSPYQQNATPTGRLTVVARHIATKRALISFIQFDGDEVAIQVARYGGVVAVLVGALFTVFYASQPQLAVEGREQAAQLSAQLASSTHTAPGTLVPISKEMVTFDVAAEAPLVGAVPVVIQIGGEMPVSSVVVSIQNTVTKQHFTLGHAARRTDRTFEIKFDTTSVPAGVYRFVANIAAQEKLHSIPSAPYEVGKPSEETKEPLPQALNDQTASTTDLPDTSLAPDTIESSPLEVDTAVASSADARPHFDETNDLPQPEEFRGLVLLPQEAPHLYDLVFYGEAKIVEFYHMRQGATTPNYIGRAYSLEPHEWRFTWNTSKLPVGEYRITARVHNGNGIVTTDPRTLSIKADSLVIAPRVSTTTLPELDATLPEPQAALRASSTVQQPMTREPASTTVRDRLPVPMLEAPLLDSTERVRYDALIKDDLARLSAALRSGDTENADRIIDMIATREEELLRETGGELDEDRRAALRQHTALRIDEAARLERIVTERLGEEGKRDSDQDGVTDYDERELFGTDPHDPDTDKDGFTDGVEIMRGFDPTDPEVEAVVMLQSPKEFGVERSDLLAVTHLGTVEPDLSASASPSAIITGTALPRAFVTLFIYSSPVIITVQADEQGNWSYQFDKELENGEHEVYVGMTDNAGAIVAKSQPMRFIKTAEAFTPIASAAETPAAPEAPTVELYSRESLLLVASISIVGIGLVLLLIGHFLRASRRDLHTLKYPTV